MTRAVYGSLTCTGLLPSVRCIIHPGVLFTLRATAFGASDQSNVCIGAPTVPRVANGRNLGANMKTGIERMTATRLDYRLTATRTFGISF